MAYKLDPLAKHATSSRPLDDDDDDDNDAAFDPLAGYTRQAAAAAPRATASDDQRLRPSMATRAAAGSGSGSGSGHGASGDTKTRRNSARRSSGQSTADEWHRREAASGGGRSRSRSRVPLEPPRLPNAYDTEEEWKLQHDAEKLDNWHHLPLLLVALPPAGAIIHGRAENWSDGLILVLIGFYLYQLIKVPWDIYYASHARLVHHPSEPKPGEEGYDPELAARRDRSIRVLRRSELSALAATMVVPFVGAYLLTYARGLLSDPERYINKFVISLYAIATGIKPFTHFAKLVKNNALYHQEQVWYPNSEVHFLRRRVETLEKDLAQLTRAFATKDDVRMLRDGVDVPLSQLSKAVRRFAINEDNHRMSAEERFSLLESKLSTFAQRAESQASLIDDLRFQQEQQAALATSSLSPVWHLLHVLYSLATNSARTGLPFWLLLPVTAPRAALEYVATAIVDIVPSEKAYGAHSYGGARIRETGESASEASETSDEFASTAKKSADKKARPFASKKTTTTTTRLFSDKRSF